MEKNKNGCVLPFIVMVLLIIFLCYSCSGSDSSEEKDYDDYAREAKVCAMDVVSQNLKAPSTADFGLTGMTASNLYGDTWEVNGYVDAENSFGAMIRENFTVTLTLTESGYKNASVTFN